VRGEVEVRGNPSFQRQRIHRRQQADRCSRRPERTWFRLEDEPARCGADQPAELPGEAGEGHVPAEQPRFGQVDDERRIDRSVQAFAQSEPGNRDTEDDGSLSSGEPGPAG